MPNEFKAVDWMRRRREEIDHEDSGLSWEEKRSKTRRMVENDALWKGLLGQLYGSAQTPESVIKEEKKPYDS